MLPFAMLRLLALVSLALVSCKSSGGSGSVPPPPSGLDAAVSRPAPDSAKAANSSVPVVAYRDVVVGKSLPSGQLLQMGGPRWSHPRIADQVQITASGAIVSASSSHVRLWAASGALRWQVFSPSSLSRFALSRDDKWIAVAQGDFDRARVSVYELGGPLRFSMETGAVSALAFSSDGAKLAIASSAVFVYDAATGKLLKTLETLAFAVGFSADGRLITIGKDRIQRWDGTDDAGESVGSIPSSSRTSAMSRSATAVAWGNGPTLEVAKLGGEPVRIDNAAPAAITAVAVSDDGTAALIGWPGGIAVWELSPSPTKRWQVETRVKSRPAIAFGSSGNVVVASDARGVFTLEASTGKELTSKEDRLRFVGFAADGNLIVSKGKTYHLVDVRTGADGPKHEMPEGSPASNDSFLYGAGGLAVTWDSGVQGECKALRVWLSGEGERTLRPPAGCRDAPWTVGPGFVAAEGSKMTIWDLVENKLRLVLPSTPRPRIGLAFSADRHWLVTAYGAAEAPDSNRDQGTLLAVFDLTASKGSSSAHPTRELEWSEPAALRAIAILADGTIIAGTAEGTVHKASPGTDSFEKLAQLDSEIVLLEASPSGKAVAATDEDGLSAILEP
jgi:WD40 repeat protein